MSRKLGAKLIHPLSIHLTKDMVDDIDKRVRKSFYYKTRTQFIKIAIQRNLEFEQRSEKQKTLIEKQKEAQKQS